MQKLAITLILFCFTFFNSIAQTTDLAATVVAETLAGAPISQVNIYGEFQYVITIINSGNAVNDVTFSQTLSPNIFYDSATSQNPIGGADDATNLNFTGNTLTGSVANMPSNSSVEVRILVNATITPGGIATTVTVSPPDGTTDLNPSNNTSIISIDVIDVPLDFSVVHSQVSPTAGTGISNWGDTVTYNFTITNNSSIAFPLNAFSGFLELESSILNGRPIVEFESLTCLGGTNGTDCPVLGNIPTNTETISSTHEMFENTQSIEFSAGGTLTFEIVYRYVTPLCGLEIGQLEVNSFIELAFGTDLTAESNIVLTPLLEGELCPFTDICIETIQTDPIPGQPVNWNEEVTFVTTVCNNGPENANIRFFLQNLTASTMWDIISVNCTGTTGNVDCNDFTITESGQFWGTDNFTMPANTTIEVVTVVIFLEPESCQIDEGENSILFVRSGTNILSPNLTDIDFSNNTDNDTVILPPFPVCNPDDITDISITKTQIGPALPEGIDPDNTTDWGEITYEIVVSNSGAADVDITLQDYIPQNSIEMIQGTLVSVDCVDTTGTAMCQTINNINIGMPMDGVPEDGVEDIFWEIVEDDNWTLPAQSSVTFHVVVNWEPECSEDDISATNGVRVVSLSNVPEADEGNNIALSTTFFGACVDLLVQTYPEITQVSVNQNFNWVIDITNSNTSSSAINIDFEDIIGAQFTITGPPTCTVISGNATCPTFTVNGNTVTGVIPNMDGNTTMQIIIPVVAPSFGGAFTNMAEAFPNPEDNEEQTPETNISISSVQVIAPTITKSFTPAEIIQDEISILEFTVNNLPGNPTQADINFTDNLPLGLELAGEVMWVQDNGCTATFVGQAGAIAVSVSNLTFPEGVASCTFAVPVTSNIVGNYVNNSTNFTDINNLDTSQASATLAILLDTSDVDIEVLKTVTPIEAAIGDEVVFTITATNLGTTTGTDIMIFESLPEGYNYIDAVTSIGTYDVSSYFWDIEMLEAGQSETLTITALVVSANNLLNTASLESVNEVDRDDTNNEDSAEVEVNNCLQIPDGFSPNGDGINDVLVVPCIEDYPINNIKIYSRYGNLVYETNNYKNNWDGIPNQGVPRTSSVLPTGTYYYVLTIDTIQKPFVSWIYLNR